MFCELFRVLGKSQEADVMGTGSERAKGRRGNRAHSSTQVTHSLMGLDVYFGFAPSELKSLGGL